MGSLYFKFCLYLHMEYSFKNMVILKEASSGNNFKLKFRGFVCFYYLRLGEIFFLKSRNQSDEKYTL